MRKTFLLLLLIPLLTYSKEYKYDLSICMIFNNEAPYLKEWIEFHKVVGVQHFYLISHLSTDNYKEVLKPYTENGLVELFECNDPRQDAVGFMGHVQPGEYNKIIRLCKKKTKWLAIIDSDEFIFPVEKYSLVDFLKDYEEFGGVYVNWQMFGTSFVKRVPTNKLVIEVLVMQSKVDYLMCHWGKTIVRPDRVEACDIHFHHYKPNYFHVFPNKQRIPDFHQFQNNHIQAIPTFPIDLSKVRINHYWTRDEYYLNNFKLPRYAKWESRKEAEQRASQLNDHVDLEILKYIPELMQIE